MAISEAKKMITGKAAMAKVWASGLVADRPEQEFGALGRIAEQIGDAVRHALDRFAPPRGVDDQQGNDRLQREGSADDAQADRLAVRRQAATAISEDGGNADQSEQLVHGYAAPPRPYQTMPWVAPAAASSSKLIASSGVSPTSIACSRVWDRKPDCRRHAP